MHTEDHLHFNFEFLNGGNRSTGVTIVINRHKFLERHIVSAESSTAVDIAGRVAHIRYVRGREDISILVFFPPRPTTTFDKRKYWQQCTSMLHLAEARVSKLTNRCLQLAFGDINDDVGQSKQNGETTRVQSLAVGEAIQGLERFVDSKFREFCKQNKTTNGSCQHFL